MTYDMSVKMTCKKSVEWTRNRSERRWPKKRSEKKDLDLKERVRSDEQKKVATSGLVIGGK